MIASFHLCDVGPRAAARLLRRSPTPSAVAGLRFGATMMSAPLSGAFPPRPPRLRRVCMAAFWEHEAALDDFLAEHQVAAELAGGWCVRLEPVRHVFAFHELSDLPSGTPMSAEEPVAVLTLGRARLGRFIPFMRSNARAAGLAVSDPALLAATGFARPPRLVGTFSLWRTTAEMRAFATGRSGPSHRDAIAADRTRTFTHEKMFIRFRPYQTVGHWDGSDPLAATATRAMA